MLGGDCTRFSDLAIGSLLDSEAYASEWEGRAEGGRRSFVSRESHASDSRLGPSGRARRIVIPGRVAVKLMFGVVRWGKAKGRLWRRSQVPNRPCLGSIAGRENAPSLRFCQSGDYRQHGVSNRFSPSTPVCVGDGGLKFSQSQGHGAGGMLAWISEQASAGSDSAWHPQ